MGTHPIFESDFDCLTGLAMPGEKRRKVEQQSRSLAAVKEELETLNIEKENLENEKHRLFSEFKKVCEKEKEDQEKQERLNLDTRVGMPQTQSPYLTQAQYDSKGKLSIMGNRPGV